MPVQATSDATRKRILEAAFTEFYRRGFQGGSLNRIVAAAGITKGALFHHFHGKDALGYQVVEEVIRPFIEGWWIRPLNATDDPVRTLLDILGRLAAESHEALCQGCPLNNLAQEMSPLDEEFRRRINAIYDAWRASLRGAFERAQAAGRVRADLSPDRTAAFIVAALAGMMGTAKNAQCCQLLRLASAGMEDYLMILKA